jgi:hypothetical protein
MSEEYIKPEKTPVTGTQSIGQLGSLLAAIGICLLSLSFLGSFAVATIWSFAFLLGLPVWMTYPLYVLAAVGTIWATIWVTGRAWHVEKLLEGHKDIDPPVFEVLHYFRKAKGN